MDTRRLLTTMLIVGVVMLAFPYVSRMWSGSPPAATTAPAMLYAKTAPAAAAPAEAGAKPDTLRLGDPSAGSMDKLSIVINNVTADIDEADLNINDYTQFPKDRRHPTSEPLRLFKYTEGVPRPFATLAVHYAIGGGVGNEDLYALQFVWKMERDPADPYTAHLKATFQDDKGKPTFRITKTFRISPASYEVFISNDVENLTDSDLTIAIDQLAATDLPLDISKVEDRFYHAASLDKTKQQIEAEHFNLSHVELAKFDTTNTRSVGSFNQANPDPLEWIACSGRFFVAITRPLPETTAPARFTLADKKTTIPVATHVASAFIDRLVDNKTDPEECVGAIRLVGSQMTVKPHATLSLPLSVYIGPKKQSVLQGIPTKPEGTPDTNDYIYANLQYASIIQIGSATCAVYRLCPIDWLAAIMLKFLDFLKNTVTFGNYGFAIIILVILIKAALHPLTRMAQTNMAIMSKKMKDVAPLVEANKKKYAKDKQKQQLEMMRIYKENNVNPAGGALGCLPMFLQTPIWIAVWMGLRSDIDLRHAAFIPGWISDLSAPDFTIMFEPFKIPLLSGMMGPISGLNILPLLLGIVVFVQMKVQQASQPTPSDPQQAQMAKMSQYMILLFPLFLYNQPSAINLYYFASTLGGLVDTYLVRKSLKKKGILPATAKMLPTHEEPA